MNRWDDRLATGLETIDAQHRWLFSLAEEVLQEGRACSLKSKTDSCEEIEESAMEDAIFGLSEYVMEHFRDEEDYMMASGYPNLGTHRLLHGFLAEHVAVFLARYNRGDRDVAGEMSTFISDWLVNHIEREDMSFAEWLKGKA